MARLCVGALGDRRSALGAVLLSLTFFLATGCASTTDVQELLDDPYRYDGREVTVEGEVRESLALLGPGVYRLQDATGILPVFSEEGGAPRSGARVRVTGTFRAAFTLGSRTAAVLVEEGREVR